MAMSEEAFLWMSFVQREDGTADHIQVLASYPPAVRVDESRDPETGAQVITVHSSTSWQSPGGLEAAR